MVADNKYRKVFSKNLSNYMNLKGKTQTDIINDLNINKSAISSWCNGTRLPRMNKVKLLADYLGISISDLISDDLTSSKYFQFIAKDDSMIPLIGIGDIVLVERTDTYRNGNTCLISIDDTTIFIRKIVDFKDYIELHTTVSYSKPIVFTKNDMKKRNFKILGKVIRVENYSAFT